MWQRVAIVAGLGFIAGFVVAMLVAGATILKSKVADTNQTRTLQLPVTEETVQPTTESSPAPETKSESKTAPAETKTKTNTTTPPVTTPPIAGSDLGCNLSEIEKYKIEKWIKDTNRNIYGDPSDTVYTGGTPLFNEFTGKYIERCQYIIDNHPTKPWNG